MTPQSITYTFSPDLSIPELRGRTVTGGRPAQRVIDGSREDVVEFPAVRVRGKMLVVRVAGKPDLAAEVARYKTDVEALRAQERDALEAAVPGLHALRDAVNAYMIDAERAKAALERTMDQGLGGPSHVADPALAERVRQLRAQYPRAAVYMDIERETVQESEIGIAAREALAMLADGATVEDAQAHLARVTEECVARWATN